MEEAGKVPEKVLGILGGLGPMATVYFYEMLTRSTKAARDQEHLNIVISSRAATPDRTAFILGRSKDDPFAALSADAARLVAFGAQVIAMPCNTAHYFYDRLQASLPVPLLNMVESTVERAQKDGCRRVGLLATAGTVQTGIYRRACARRGLVCAVPDAAAQAAVTDVIYNNVKQGKPADMAAFGRAVDSLKAQGCERAILGCTELSVVRRDEHLGSWFLDAMAVLAEAAIRACGKTPVGLCPNPPEAPPLDSAGLSDSPRADA